MQPEKRKIAAMHLRFGVLPEKRCEDCDHLIKGYYHTKYLRKCEVYGATHSEASDWRKKYIACGLYNQEWKGPEIIRLINSGPREQDQIMPLEGQIEMEL